MSRKLAVIECLLPQLGVALSVERLRSKGRHGVNLQVNCVIHAWVIWDYALYKWLHINTFPLLGWAKSAVLVVVVVGDVGVVVVVVVVLVWLLLGWLFDRVDLIKPVSNVCLSVRAWCTTVCSITWSKVKVTSPLKLEIQLPALPFPMGAGNWPLILKLGLSVYILSGRIFDFYLSFCVT